MSLFPKGHKDPLFRSRMIRPVLGGRGLYLSETNLGSGDGKPVQQIERKGVGEELTTCGGYPQRTRSLTSYNSRRLVSASSMKRLIYIDGQDKQDYLAERFQRLEFDHRLFFNKDFKNPLPSSWITAHAYPIIERVSFLCSSFSSCLSCLSCLSMFPNAANRINGTCPYSRKAIRIRCFALE